MQKALESCPGDVGADGDADADGDAGTNAGAGGDADADGDVDGDVAAGLGWMLGVFFKAHNDQMEGNICSGVTLFTHAPGDRADPWARIETPGCLLGFRSY